MLIDTAVLGSSLPALFQNKATLRQVFYGKLLEQAPNLEAHFLKNDVRQTEMFEKFIGDMMRSVVGGQSTRAFADKFAQSHRGLKLTSPELATAKHAFHKAILAALCADGAEQAKVEATWLPFLDQVFHDFEQALMPGTEQAG